MKRGSTRGFARHLLCALATPLSMVEGRSVGSASLANATTTFQSDDPRREATLNGPRHFHAPAIRRYGAPSARMNDARYETPASSPRSVDLLRLRAPSSRPIAWVQIKRLRRKSKVDVPKHSRARAQNVAPGVLGPPDIPVFTNEMIRLVRAPQNSLRVLRSECLPPGSEDWGHPALDSNRRPIQAGRANRSERDGAGVDALWPADCPG
jgi:hypothetical protein